MPLNDDDFFHAAYQCFSSNFTRHLTWESINCEKRKNWFINGYQFTDPRLEALYKSAILEQTSNELYRLWIPFGSLMIIIFALNGWMHFDQGNNWEKLTSVQGLISIIPVGATILAWIFVFTLHLCPPSSHPPSSHTSSPSLLSHRTSLSHPSSDSSPSLAPLSPLSPLSPHSPLSPLSPTHGRNRLTQYLLLALLFIAQISLFLQDHNFLTQGPLPISPPTLDSLINTPNTSLYACIIILLLSNIFKLHQSLAIPGIFASGCLTLVFESVVRAPGWIARTGVPVMFVVACSYSVLYANFNLRTVIASSFQRELQLTLIRKQEDSLRRKGVNERLFFLKLTHELKTPLNGILNVLPFLRDCTGRDRRGDERGGEERRGEKGEEARGEKEEERRGEKGEERRGERSVDFYVDTVEACARFMHLLTGNLLDLGRTQQEMDSYNENSFLFFQATNSATHPPREKRGEEKRGEEKGEGKELAIEIVDEGLWRERERKSPFLYCLSLFSKKGGNLSSPISPISPLPLPLSSPPPLSYQNSSKMNEKIFNLEFAVRSSLHMNSATARIKNLSLNANLLHAKDCFIWGEYSYLIQCVNNVISNGLKYTSEGNVAVHVFVRPWPLETPSPVPHCSSKLLTEDAEKTAMFPQRLHRITHKDRQEEGKTGGAEERRGGRGGEKRTGAREKSLSREREKEKKREKGRVREERREGEKKGESEACLEKDSPNLGSFWRRFLRKFIHVFFFRSRVDRNSGVDERGARNRERRRREKIEESKNKNKAKEFLWNLNQKKHSTVSDFLAIPIDKTASSLALVGGNAPSQPSLRSQYQQKQSPKITNPTSVSEKKKSRSFTPANSAVTNASGIETELKSRNKVAEKKEISSTYDYESKKYKKNKKNNPVFTIPESFDSILDIIAPYMTAPPSFPSFTFDSPISNWRMEKNKNLSYSQSSLHPPFELVQICISVSDTGIGLTAAARTKLFKEFSQARPGDRSIGTGLGLSLTRNLMRKLGGDCALSSEGEGKGTCSLLYFPAYRVLPPNNSNANANAGTQVDNANNANMRIANANTQANSARGREKGEKEIKPDLAQPEREEMHGDGEYVSIFPRLATLKRGELEDVTDIRYIDGNVAYKFSLSNRRNSSNLLMGRQPDKVIAPNLNTPIPPSPSLSSPSLPFLSPSSPARDDADSDFPDDISIPNENLPSYHQRSYSHETKKEEGEKGGEKKADEGENPEGREKRVETRGMETREVETLGGETQKVETTVGEKDGRGEIGEIENDRRIADYFNRTDSLALIVDDDFINREILKLIVARSGIPSQRIFSSDDGYQAAEQVKKLLKDTPNSQRKLFIITDMQMPNGDGLWFAKTVRNKLFFRQNIMSPTQHEDEKMMKTSNAFFRESAWECEHSHRLFLVLSSALPTDTLIQLYPEIPFFFDDLLEKPISRNDLRNLAQVFAKDIHQNFAQKYLSANNANAPPPANPLWTPSQSPPTSLLPSPADTQRDNTKHTHLGERGEEKGTPEKRASNGRREERGRDVKQGEERIGEEKKLGERKGEEKGYAGEIGELLSNVGDDVFHCESSVFQEEASVPLPPRGVLSKTHHKTPKRAVSFVNAGEEEEKEWEADIASVQSSFIVRVDSNFSYPSLKADENESYSPSADGNTSQSPDGSDRSHSPSCEERSREDSSSDASRQSESSRNENSSLSLTIQLGLSELNHVSR